MIYLLSFFMLIAGYYTLSYGISLYQDEGNLLGGVATIGIALIGTIIPIIVLFIKQ